MIAKLIVHGDDRAGGHRALLLRVWQYTAGVHTNIEFLHRSPAPLILEARLDTALIEREGELLFCAAARAPPRIAWDLAVLAFVLSQRRPPIFDSPWMTQRWRPGAAGQRTTGSCAVARLSM
jgi:acetyl/propionyl-CoA carboxylase alpha subunit